MLNKQKEVEAFRKTLSKESDRGCALYATSYLDKAISDLLYCALAYDKKIDKDLFEGTAPLATFSARIKMAFYLGKISKIERRDLDLLRKIRNLFAHSADEISFEDEKINNQCRALSFTYHEKNHRARGHFTASCHRLLGNITGVTFLCTAPEIKADNAPTEEQKLKTRESAQKKYDELIKA
jgi:DNA-binding MltR family transcriptional regulator